MYKVWKNQYEAIYQEYAGIWEELQKVKNKEIKGEEVIRKATHFAELFTLYDTSLLPEEQVGELNSLVDKINKELKSEKAKQSPFQN
jgi:hypothetical protein